MSLATESIHLAKRKVFNYLSGGTKGEPFVHEQFRALFSFLSQHGSNPDLEFKTFADLTGDTVIADAANKVYAIYFKKQNTATDAFAKAVDHATVAAGDAFFVCVELNVGKDIAVVMWPKGLANSAGITLVSSTTHIGTTDTTTGDGPDGFVLLGAA